MNKNKEMKNEGSYEWARISKWKVWIYHLPLKIYFL